MSKRFRHAGWFEVSREGLAQTVARRGWSWVIAELVQNCWDEDGVSQVSIRLEPVPGKPEAILVVEDDAPQGFRDLADGYTLFGKSYKKDQPQKRGRFDLGEKLVLSRAIEAEISTTKGTVRFASDERIERRRKRARGSMITARFRMTHAACAEAVAGAEKLIPPDGIVTTLNGEMIQPRVPCAEFQWSLPTEISDSDGVLRPTERKTIVRLYEPREGEAAALYEGGIPVVETGDRWHVNVAQKIPLTLERDNVRPSYLRLVRTLTLNAMHDQITADDATSSWVTEAVQDKRVEVKAVETYLDRKYGEDRVAYDPTRTESVSRAQSQGYAVLYGANEAATTWEKIREGGLAPPAGQAFPPNIEDIGAEIPTPEWTEGMCNIAAYAKALAVELLNCEIDVRMTRNPEAHIEACYGHRTLTFNVGALGEDWFAHGATEQVNGLIIHEFGHETTDNHLSAYYHAALCTLGAKLVRLALDQPEFFAPYITI